MVGVAIFNHLEVKGQKDSLPEAPEQLQEMVEQLKKERNDEEISGLEIDGLLIDETLTKIGRDFYDIFYRQWSAPAAANNFSILIKEKPVPGLGTLITIEINDEEIFSRRIPPRYDVVENFAKYAVYQAQQHLLEVARLEDQLENADQSGTGIF